MRSIFYISVVTFLGLLLSGCAPKVGVKALEPAEVDKIADTKVITVTTFSRDTVGLGNKIEVNLSQFQLDNKKYFTIVSRNDFSQIINEQKFQGSGLIDTSTAVELGKLIGAQAIISGNVARPTSQNSYYYEKRTRCADSDCKKMIYYNVSCKKLAVGLSAEIRIVDVSKGDIIFAQTFNKTSVYKHCSDDSRAMPSRDMAAQALSNEIANEFTYKLTPHYKYFKVTLLDEPDLDYTDEQEELLELALEYIKQNNYDKASSMLVRLIDSTNSKSYVAFYNLGVIGEAKGDYEDAKEYYETANNLMMQPVAEISSAMIRIDSLIAKRDKTNEQINR